MEGSEGRGGEARGGLEACTVKETYPETITLCGWIERKEVDAYVCSDIARVTNIADFFCCYRCYACL